MINVYYTYEDWFPPNHIDKSDRTLQDMIILRHCGFKSGSGNTEKEKAENSE